MGKKASLHTTRGVDNMMKAAGLQKLKHYCQLCQKQCRDDNGFKLHTQSDGHLRQVQLFLENPDKVVDQFSRQFCAGYMSVVRKRGRDWIDANTLYKDYISDRHHIHMNGTQWSTLSNFITYLVREDKVLADRRGGHLYIKLLDEATRERMRAKNREKVLVSDEERARRRVARQVAAARMQAQLNGEEVEDIPEEDRQFKADGKIEFELKKKQDDLSDSENESEERQAEEEKKPVTFSVKKPGKGLARPPKKQKRRMRLGQVTTTLGAAVAQKTIAESARRGSQRRDRRSRSRDRRSRRRSRSRSRDRRRDRDRRRSRSRSRDRRRSR